MLHGVVAQPIEYILLGFGIRAHPAAEWTGLRGRIGVIRCDSLIVCWRELRQGSCKPNRIMKRLCHGGQLGDL